MDSFLENTFFELRSKIVNFGCGTDTENANARWVTAFSHISEQLPLLLALRNWGQGWNIHNTDLVHKGTSADLITTQAVHRLGKGRCEELYCKSWRPKHSLLLEMVTVTCGPATTLKWRNTASASPGSVRNANSSQIPWISSFGDGIQPLCTSASSSYSGAHAHFWNYCAGPCDLVCMLIFLKSSWHIGSETLGVSCLFNL